MFLLRERRGFAAEEFARPHPRGRQREGSRVTRQHAPRKRRAIIALQKKLVQDNRCRWSTSFATEPLLRGRRRSTVWGQLEPRRQRHSQEVPRRFRPALGSEGRLALHGV